MTTVRVAPGDVLRGKYRIKRVLGQGGVGIVVRATHLRLDQDVAIKMLRDANAPAHVVERFAREARAAARLRGQHAVRILDVDDEGGAPFLVMEYLEGRDLERIVSEDGPLPIADAANVLLQACEGLAEAHALGIVHRDVKPANLFLAHTPRGGDIVKILDFGISKASEDSQPLITETERILGSPAFMSPEQLRAAHDVDVRADIWALGVVAYVLVTGKLPFDGNTATEVAARIAADEPRPIVEHRADIPEDLASAIMKCLSKRREERFPTVATLARALAPFAREGDAAARRVSSVLRIPVSSPHAVDTDTSFEEIPQSTQGTESLPGVANVFPPPLLTGSADAPGPMSLGASDRPPPPERAAPKRPSPPRRMLPIAVTGGVVALAALGYVATRGADRDDRGARTSSSAKPAAAPASAGALPAPGQRCEGTLRVRVLYDATGPTRDVGNDSGKGVVDHLRAIDRDGGVRGCRIELLEGDTKYNAEATLSVYHAWQSNPDWRNVDTIFSQGTPMVQAIGPLAASEHKIVVSTALGGELASPLPVSRDIAVKSLSSSFREATVPVNKRSPGYPYVFFQGTDYTTAARVAMSFAWKRGAKRVGFFACSTSAFCTDPIEGAKTFLPALGGTKIGRDLALELDDDDATVEKKVEAYFKAELAQAARDPSYEPVDWIWFGNTRAGTARLARALARVKERLPFVAWVITGNWGVDEHVHRECGEDCVGFYTTQPFPSFGDGAAVGMKRLVDVHHAERKLDSEPENAHATIHYISGYVAVAAWRAAVETVLDGAKPVTGANLKAAFETFKQRPIEGFASVTYSAEDHRPQSSARIYAIGKTGRLEPLGQPLSIALQPDWLGW